MQRRNGNGNTWLTNRVKAATGIVVFIGAVATGIWAMDARFAKAEETNQRFNALQQIIVQGQTKSDRRALESEKRLLEREQFDYLTAQERRQLKPLEQQRLKIVTEEVGKLDAQIKMMVEKEKK